MKKLILQLAFSFSFFAIKAQSTADTFTIDIATINDSLLINNCQLFIDSNRNLTAATVVQKKWLELAAFKANPYIPKYWITRPVFLKFEFLNSGNFTDTFYLFPGSSFKQIKIFVLQNNNQLGIIQNQSEADGYQPFALHANERKTIIVELYFNKSSFDFISPQIIKSSYLHIFQSVHYNKNELLKTVGFLFSGVLLMMLLFSIANYLLSGKKEFLLNGLFTTCMFLLFFLTNYFDRKTGIAAGLVSTYFAFALLAIGTIFYIAFTRIFLNTKQTLPILNKIFIYEERGIFLIFICFTILNFFTNDFYFQNILENIMKVTAIGTGLIYITMAIAKKDKLLNYLAAGNAILIFFAIVSYYILLLKMGRKTIFTSAFFYFELGIIGELFLFLLGLTYKNRIELIEKIKEQEALKLEAEKQSFETKLTILNVRQNERSRISADMHDDLGAGITAIRLYSELVKSKLGNEVHPEIEKISTSANELLNNMNAIIWAMSSSNDSLESMMAYIRSYAQEYFDNTGISCKFIFDNEIPSVEVNGQMRKNVFLVIKEALNNIVKYAKATEVTITAKRVHDGFLLTIQDNGIGIDFDNLRHFGNGLKNMKTRMDEMKINFSIENNNGTIVTLHYPINL